jgi:hypothetical protein
VPNIDPARLRTVHLITQIDAFKALYFDRDGMALRPNLVFVDANGSVVFETNEIGLKGDALDPARRLAVVWGDSVVFGSGRGWAHLLDPLAPGYQFLNGGLNGDPYGNILRRASGMNRRLPVALNLLMLGWHPLVAMPAGRGPPRWDRLTQGSDALPRVELLRNGNDGLRAELSSFLEATPNTVVLTMPTALNAGIAGRDLSDRLVRADDEIGFESRTASNISGSPSTTSSSATPSPVRFAPGMASASSASSARSIPKMPPTSASISGTSSICARVPTRRWRRSFTIRSRICSNRAASLPSGRGAGLSAPRRPDILSRADGPTGGKSRWISPIHLNMPNSAANSAPGSTPTCPRS